MKFVIQSSSAWSLAEKTNWKLIMHPRDKIYADRIAELRTNPTKYHLIGQGDVSRCYKISGDEVVIVTKVSTPEQKSRIHKSIAFLRKVGRLHHESVEKIGTGDAETYYIFQPLLAGKDFTNLMLDQGKEWTTHNKLKLALGIACKLKELHAKGMVHNDLHPSNILYDEKTGEINLLDFDLSEENGKSASRPRDKQGMFVAPELKIANAKVTYAADIYSLGKLLTTGMSAGVAVSDSSSDATADANLGLNLHLSNSGIGPHMQQLFAAMTVNSPVARPGMEVVIRGLEDALELEEIKLKLREQLPIAAEVCELPDYVDVVTTDIPAYGDLVWYTVKAAGDDKTKDNKTEKFVHFMGGSSIKEILNRGRKNCPVTDLPMRNFHHAEYLRQLSVAIMYLQGIITIANGKFAIKAGVKDENGDFVKFLNGLTQPEAYLRDGLYMLQGIMDGKLTLAAEERQFLMEKFKVDKLLGYALSSDPIASKVEMDSQTSIPLEDSAPKYLQALYAQHKHWGTFHSLQSLPFVDKHPGMTPSLKVISSHGAKVNTENPAIKVQPWIVPNSTDVPSKKKDPLDNLDDDPNCDCITIAVKPAPMPAKKDASTQTDKDIQKDQGAQIERPVRKDASTETDPEVDPNHKISTSIGIQGAPPPSPPRPSPIVDSSGILPEMHKYVERAKKAKWKTTNPYQILAVDYSARQKQLEGNYARLLERFKYHLDKEPDKPMLGAIEQAALQAIIDKKQVKHAHQVERGYHAKDPRKLVADDELRREIREHMTAEISQNLSDGSIQINVEKTTGTSFGPRLQQATSKLHADGAVEFKFSHKQLDQALTEQVVEHLAEYAAATSGTIEISGCRNNLRAALDLMVYTLASTITDSLGRPNFNFELKNDGTRDLLQRAGSMADDELIEQLTRHNAELTPGDLLSYKQVLVDMQRYAVRQRMH